MFYCRVQHPAVGRELLERARARARSQDCHEGPRLDFAVDDLSQHLADAEHALERKTEVVDDDSDGASSSIRRRGSYDSRRGSGAVVDDAESPAATWANVEIV